MTMYFPHDLQISDLNGACVIQYVPGFNQFETSGNHLY